MTPRSLAFVLGITAATLAPRLAPAQPPMPATPPSAEAVKRADASYKQGVRLYSEKKWAEAEAAFRAAWELNPTFDVAYNLGSAEYQLGKFRDAAEHLSLAVHGWPLIRATSGLRQTAQQRLAESRAHVAALTVKVNVEHAEVLVDGRPAGRSPLALEVFVTAGAHKIEAKLDGYDDATIQVQAAQGSTQAVALTLSPRAAPPSAATADSAPVTPPVATAVTPPPMPSTTATPPPVRPGPSVPAVIAGGSATLAALVVGAVLAGVANKKASDAGAMLATLPTTGRAGQCQVFASTCSAINGDLHARDTLSDASVGMFIGAGVLGLASLGYALIPRKPQAGAGIRVLPVGGSRNAGATMMGVW